MNNHLCVSPNERDFRHQIGANVKNMGLIFIYRDEFSV
jgi:hypothetical protein